MRSTRYTLITFGSLLLSSSLLVPVSSSAQKRSPTSAGGGGTSSRDKILGREADIQSRELQLRLLTEGGKAASPANEHSAEDRKLIVNQIFEDFERIQLVNREMMQLSANLNTPAYKRMSSLAEEMTKRAKRLKTNLGIPDVIHEKKEPDSVPEMDVAQVKASLQTISASVKSFVGNPLFQDPRVTDVRQLDNLRRDISTLIELSRAVKKAAGKLGH
jgi:hypothetical protein